MSYTRINWENEPSTATPLNETNLNKMDAALYNMDAAITGLQSGKQDVLTFDDTPTSGSNNPVKSGGIYTALGTKVDKVTGKGLSTNDFTTAEKDKLSGIATGAEVNQNAFSNVKVGSTTIAADSKTDTLELAAGSNVTLTPDATNDKVTISATNTTYSDATTTTHGLMSASDKTKLDGIATGAEVNQNAFSNIKVGSTTIAADNKTDTLEFVAGSNIAFTPDATNDSIVISSTAVDDQVLQEFTTANSNFRVLLAHGVNNDDEVTTAYKVYMLRFNPSKSNLIIGDNTNPGKINSVLVDNQIIGTWLDKTGAVGDTSITFNSSIILSTSILELYAQTSSGKPVPYTSVSVTNEASATFTIPALSEAASFKLWIRNLT